MSTLRFSAQSGAIIIETDIKAERSTKIKLILDTGASSLVLPTKLIQETGLKIDPKRKVKTATATAIESAFQVIIPEVTALGQTVKNVSAIIKDLPPSAPASGLLGLSFLKHFKLTIDFKKGLLSLE